ncbi:hypothetical protein STEG23_005305 [Scotinomys teguina]
MSGSRIPVPYDSSKFNFLQSYNAVSHSNSTRHVPAGTLGDQNKVSNPLKLSHGTIQGEYCEQNSGPRELIVIESKRLALEKLLQWKMKGHLEDALAGIISQTHLVFENRTDNGTEFSARVFIGYL